VADAAVDDGADVPSATMDQHPPQSTGLIHFGMNFDLETRQCRECGDDASPLHQPESHRTAID
jgi:hypothetical protein